MRNVMIPQRHSHHKCARKNTESPKGPRNIPAGTAAAPVETTLIHFICVKERKFYPNRSAKRIVNAEETRSAILAAAVNPVFAVKAGPSKNGPDVSRMLREDQGNIAKLIANARQRAE